MMIGVVGPDAAARLIAAGAVPLGSTALAERSGRAIGSPIRLVIAADEPTADAAWLTVKDTLRDVDMAMSRFRDDSELTTLNRRAGVAVDGVSRMLIRGLVAADRARRVTGGRFDPRIVGALERIGYAGVPQGDGSDDPTPARGGRIIIREGRRGAITLPEPVDLGGIGKGLALRWAAAAIERVLDGAGPDSVRPGYLLDAGGDIVLAGTPAAGEPWHVGIEDPGGDSVPVATLKSHGRLAIATSSIRRLRWRRGGRDVHHLIDPRTGEPGGAGLLAVTVAGPDPAWAEVWSKALFLEGATGIASAARSRGLAAWWICDDGRLEMTPGARQRTTWVAGDT